MQVNRIIRIIILLITIGSFTAQSQGFLKVNGKAITNHTGDTVILRGMGLGGWMLQEGYMLQTSDFANAQYQIKLLIQELIGESDTELFYDAWLANHVRKSDIDSLKAWGFNSVRLPMHYNLFTLPIEDEPEAGKNTWLNTGFELTDSLISWCKMNDMHVILDLHAAPGGQGYDQGISDYDPTKPSLWESQENRNKTVALWKRIAEHYADEPYVAGYDLINEPNWNLTGNSLLRSLYGSITDAIRTVDQNHIIFIEGNWFANDYTGLTPPWDDNMVYSPHKYWSYNDQASIQWMIDIGNNFNVPIYFGESGENSNVWFRDAIRLLEDNGIGWAWWPLKKIDAIAGPLSVHKTESYQTILNYWAGTGPKPSTSYAKAGLMEMTENLKIENCLYRRDVIDGMFRQVYSDAPLPYANHNIPGVIHATDYDLGRAGFAYHDVDLANYHVTTGNYTAWNNGWSYRNDGVDIEKCTDSVNTNGYNVGWTQPSEWLQYQVNVAEAAAYDVHLRVASSDSESSFHFKTDHADISTTIEVPNTGGFQNWQTITIHDLILTPEDQALQLYIDRSSFNVSSFEFIKSAPTDSIATEFVSARTVDLKTIQVHINKSLNDLPGDVSNDFGVLINGSQFPVIGVESNAQNHRILTISIDHEMRSSETIRVSYTGEQVFATDGTILQEFIWEDVQNNLKLRHDIPGVIQAEKFSEQSGIELENTSDTGGGQNIGFLDAGDFAVYDVKVSTSGIYKVNYRTAALDQTGEVRLYTVSANGDQSLLHQVSFPPTGGWQTWKTSEFPAVFLPSGTYKIRLEISKPLFNINWFEFTSTTSTNQLTKTPHDIVVYPNPTSGQVNIESKFEGSSLCNIHIYNLKGNTVALDYARLSSGEIHTMDISNQIPGQYFVVIRFENDQIVVKSIVLQ